MTTCNHTHATYELSPKTVQCFREVNENGRHIGEHQGWLRIPKQTLTKPITEEKVFVPARKQLWTWNEGGALGQSVDSLDDLSTCSECSIFVKHTESGKCSMCTYWSYRIDQYHSKSILSTRSEGLTRLIRPRNDVLASTPWLYCWSQGHGGAFGGRQFIVRWDDGTVAGPGDYLWSNGRIPWWLVDHFPPNGEVEVADKIRRAGHTNAYGQPLEYTAHPIVRKERD